MTDSTPELEPAPPTTEPTQIQHPWRASLRTGAETAAAALFALVVGLPVVQDFVETVAPGSPVAGWIAGAAGITAAASIAITRLVALPAVDAFLTRFGLGAKPKGKHAA